MNNHVDGDTYDAAGDVTIDSLNQYAYDGDGRLCAAYSGDGAYTEYIYNAEGDRVAKGSASNLSCNPASDGFALTNRYIIDPTGQQLSEMDGSGNWLHTNVFAGGKLLATYSSSNTYFALTDWLGTKRVETDSSGNKVSTSYSLPFGDNLVVDGSPDATEHHFTSKEHDSATGNDYFLARYYNSATGRFLSPDWSKNPEGVPYADFTDPQSLNLYDYMRNNPLGGVDADGHCCEADFDSFQTPEQREIHPPTEFDRQFGSVMKGALELGAAAIAGPEVLAAAGDAGTSLEVLKVGVATLGVTGTAINGTTDVVGGMTNTETGAATNAVTTVTNPVAAGVAIVTGSTSAGSNAADAATAGKAVADVASGKGVQNAPEVANSIGGAIDAAKGAAKSIGSFFSTPNSPPAPKPPSTPGCNVKGAC